MKRFLVPIWLSFYLQRDIRASWRRFADQCCWNKMLQNVDAAYKCAYLTHFKFLLWNQIFICLFHIIVDWFWEENINVILPVCIYFLLNFNMVLFDDDEVDTLKIVQCLCRKITITNILKSSIFCVVCAFSNIIGCTHVPTFIANHTTKTVWAF